MHAGGRVAEVLQHPWLGYVGAAPAPAGAPPSAAACVQSEAELLAAVAQARRAGRRRLLAPRPAATLPGSPGDPGAALAGPMRNGAEAGPQAHGTPPGAPERRRGTSSTGSSPGSTSPAGDGASSSPGSDTAAWAAERLHSAEERLVLERRRLRAARRARRPHTVE